MAEAADYPRTQRVLRAGSDEHRACGDGLADRT